MGKVNKEEFETLIRVYKVILQSIRNVSTISEFIGCIMMLGAYISLYFHKVDGDKYCFGSAIVTNDKSSNGLSVICELRNILANFKSIEQAINIFDAYKMLISNVDSEAFDTVINDTLLMLKEFDNSKIDKLLDSIRNSISNTDSTYMSGLEALSNMSLLAVDSIGKKG